MKAVAFALLLSLAAAPSVAATPSSARVRLDTEMGPIVIEVDLKRAPITSRNFLAYVDRRLFDGRTFYRAARRKDDPKLGLVQGGIDHKVHGALIPIAHEPTSKTGLSHVDGTVSMARNAPGTAMGDFFITVGPSLYLDATADKPGYAAFGRVVSGMPIVRRILALPTHPGGYSRATMGQSIRKPVLIRTARRVR